MQQVSMFKAFDGALFATEDECKAYESVHEPPYWGIVGIDENTAKAAWEDPIDNKVAQAIITSGYALAAIRRRKEREAEQADKAVQTNGESQEKAAAE
jgi:hypothetical protein